MTESQEIINAEAMICYAHCVVNHVDIQDLDASVTAVLWRALEIQLKMQGLDIEMLLMARDGS